MLKTQPQNIKATAPGFPRTRARCSRTRLSTAIVDSFVRYKYRLASGRSLARIFFVHLRTLPLSGSKRTSCCRRRPRSWLAVHLSHLLGRSVLQSGMLSRCSEGDRGLRRWSSHRTANGFFLGVFFWIHRRIRRSPGCVIASCNSVGVTFTVGTVHRDLGSYTLGRPAGIE